MKPGEFDELVRQKFDQNDFAYSPRNWDRLAEQMDGRAKKRSMFLWLWMPVTGMAASVALAIGVTTLFKFNAPAGHGNGGYAATGKFTPRERSSNAVAMVPDVTLHAEPALKKTQPSRTRAAARPAAQPAVAAGNGIGLKLKNMMNDGQQPATNKYAATDPNLNAAAAQKTLPVKTERKPAVAVHTPMPMQTFREEGPKVAKKKLNFSVILSGGVNQGNNNSGYMAGATVRKMLNDKVYVESDIAFASSDNVQRTKVMSYENAGGAAGGGGGSMAAKPTSASKVSSEDAAALPANNPPVGVIKTQDISYNLSYAQITPGIGVKIMKRMSIGMGPDFQKMLVDNRPATSTVDRENIQVAPSFDVGFVGKTEFAFTNRVKAGVAYRKGINGVINPSDKFIDRDYLQFQMKCTIFNK